MLAIKGFYENGRVVIQSLPPLQTATAHGSGGDVSGGNRRERDVQ